MAFLEDKEEPAGGGCVLVIPFWAEAPQSLLLVERNNSDNQRKSPIISASPFFAFASINVHEPDRQQLVIGGALSFDLLAHGPMPPTGGSYSR
jgi:hypothetical protein